MDKNYDKLFINDKLGIKEDVIGFAQLIEQEKYIDCVESAKVYAISAEFGIGKTFFCERLKDVLAADNVPVTKMNIWEMDFYEDPLIPILANLNELYAKNGENLPTKVIGKIMDFAKKGVLAVGEYFAEAVSNKLTGTGIVDKIDSHFNPETIYDDFNDYKDTVNELHNKITDWAKTLDKPAVIIIDELDRCRPDYAIKTLETLKHFFNISGLVFVLALDEQQLESSVKCLFGTTNFDGYKRKFINNSFLLLAPDKRRFTDFLYEKSGIGNIIKQIQDSERDLIFTIRTDYIINYYDVEARTKKDTMHRFNELQTSESIIKRYFAAYSIWFKFTLRQMEQVFDRLVLFAREIAISDELFSPDLAVLLVCLHEFDAKICNKLRHHNGIINRIIQQIHGSTTSFSHAVYENRKEISDRFGNFDRNIVPEAPLVDSYSADETTQIIYDNVERFFTVEQNQQNPLKWLTEFDVYGSGHNNIINNCRIALITKPNDPWKEQEQSTNNIKNFNLQRFRETYFNKMDFISHFSSKPIAEDSDISKIRKMAPSA